MFLLKTAAVVLLSIPLLLLGLVASSGLVVVDVKTSDGPRIVVPVPLFLARAALGFAPEEGRHEKRIVIRLHDCPFRDVARNRGDVVCSVHLGILRGMAEELGGWLSVDDLRPFVEPSLCVANLSINE